MTSSFVQNMSGQLVYSLNPKNFGCPWDGVHDDYPGLKAMMDSIPVNACARIELPPGMGYVSQTWRIPRAVHIRGAAGATNAILSGIFGAAGGSGIASAPGVTAIQFDGYYQTTDGGTAAYSSIEDVDLVSHSLVNSRGSLVPTILGSIGISVQVDAQWVANTFFEKGRCVVAYNGTNLVNEFQFWRSSGGTSGGTVPSIFSAAPSPAGTTVTDGTITWTCEKFPKLRVDNTAYAVGERYFFPNDNRFYFECLVPGTIGGATTAPLSSAIELGLQGLGLAPHEIGTANPNPVSTVGDNTIGVAVTGATNANPIVLDTSANHGLSVGQTIYVTGVVGNSAANGTWTVAAIPAPNKITLGPSSYSPFQPIGNGTFDAPRSVGSFISTVIFQVKSHNAIRSTARVRINHVFVTDFTNAAIHVANSSPTDGFDGSFTSVHDVHAKYCGVGVYLSGSDTNGCHVSNVYTFYTGGQYGPADTLHSNSLVGNGGHSLYPRSAANYFTSSYSQNGTGRSAYAVNTYGTAMFVGCSTENVLKDLVNFPNAIVGPGSAWDSSSSGYLIAPGGKNYYEYNPTGTKPIRGGLVQGGAGSQPVHWFGADEDCGGTAQFGWRYPPSTSQGFANSAGVLSATGWYSFGTAPYYPIDVLAVSGSVATEGKGHWRDYRGHFAGLSSPYFKGVDIFCINSNLIRGGSQQLGDRFEIAGTGVVGSWNEYVVITAGYRGIPYAVGGIGYANAIGTNGNPATTVEPTNGADQVWQFVSGSGTPSGTLGTEPAWPTISIGATFTDASSNVWKFMGPKAKYGLSKGIKDARNSVALLVETAPKFRIDTGVSADSTSLGAWEANRDAKTTTDATANVVIHSYTIPTGGIASLSWVVTCVQTAGTGNPTFGKWKVTASYFNNAGTVTVLDAAVTTAASANTVAGVTAPSTNISGTSVQLRVTGVAAKTYQWRVRCEIDATS